VSFFELGLWNVTAGSYTPGKARLFILSGAGAGSLFCGQMHCFLFETDSCRQVTALIGNIANFSKAQLFPQPCTGAYSYRAL
jgi:hypothetical protein